MSTVFQPALPSEGPCDECPDFPVFPVPACPWALQALPTSSFPILLLPGFWGLLGPPMWQDTSHPLRIGTVGGGTPG